MKTLNLIMAIVALVCTVVMDVLYPFFIPASGSNLGIVCILSAFGSIAAWIHFDKYITMVKKEAAFHAENRIKNEQKERLARELGHSDGALSDMADQDLIDLGNF